MSLPVPTITLFLDAPFDGGDFFTLDDPVKGVLDSAYVLAGDLGSDVSGYGFDIHITRGRNTEMDAVDPGTAQLTFRNHTRDLDPLNTAGPFFGFLKPGRPAIVSVYGQRIYTGTVDDWNLEYTVDLEASASVPLTDGLGLMARQSFDAWTTVAGQTAGERIAAVLDRPEVGWPGGARDIDTGVATLQSDNVTWGSQPLNYLQLIALSDLGTLFVDREGVLTFRDRHSLVNPTPTVTFSDGAYPAYLTPTVGTVTTPDPGTLPNEHVFVFTVSGPTGPETYGVLAAQCDNFTQYAWRCERAPSGSTNLTTFATGSAGGAVSTAAPTDVSDGDQTLALAVTINDGGGGRDVTAWERHGGTWVVGASATDATNTVFNSTDPIRIGAWNNGASGVFPGRIYSVELRTGLDPAAGTVLWKFDASDYPGTGTVYVDPRGRTWTLTAATAVTAAVAAGLPFHGAALDGGGVRYFNRVGIDRTGGLLQTVSDPALGEADGVRALSRGELLMDSDAQSLGMAEYLLSIYSNPVTRVGQIVVKVHALDDADAALVSSLDLNDVIHVTWTPQRLGSTIDEDMSIEGVTHSITPDEHIMTLSLAPITQSLVFTLDDALLGLLDGDGRLAF